jgi:tripartite-type tricarboxylate transporter receptor subunit TctC
MYNNPAAMPRRARSFAAACALLLVAIPAAAQYPGKPIRLIVPFPPGGTADATARIIAQPLSTSLGQPVLVENRAGADGAIAADVVIKAQPDGYTVFFGTTTALCAVPVLRKIPPYDPVVDFTPISLVGGFGFFLYVNSSVPATSLQELIEYARANPGKLNYGTGTSTSVIITAQLKLRENLDIVAVPYKGDAPALADLVAGRIQMMFAAVTAIGHVRDGRLRVLATLGTRRSPLFPDVPTTAETGLVKLTIKPWGGFFGPAKMPQAIVEKLSIETRAILARQDVREQLGRQAFEGQGSTPEELTGLLKEQLEAWRNAVREAGIQSE